MIAASALGLACRAPEPEPEPTEPDTACADAEEVCERIATGEWQVWLDADPLIQTGTMWPYGCVHSVEEAQADELFVRNNWELWWEHRAGFWVDAGLAGSKGALFRFVDCALVEESTFPWAINDQFSRATGGEAWPISWMFAPGVQPAAVAELIAAMEVSWDWADMGSTSSDSHFIYDEFSMEDAGIYSWRYCRVQDFVDVYGPHLTCHEFNYDAESQTMEMYFTWGEELPCDPGVPYQVDSDL